MTNRPLPGFLKYGDKPLGFPHPTPLSRMRAMMGMGEPEVKVPEFVERREPRPRRRDDRDATRGIAGAGNPTRASAPSACQSN